MKKKIIVITLIILLVVLILFLFLGKKREQTMICTSSQTMIGSEGDLKYIFYGVNGIALEQRLYVKLYITDEELINEYQNIMKDNLECGGFNISSDYISYECFYDLVKVHYYEALENEDGELMLEALKKDFENDNYVCIYE